jgi:hypothetical protein
MNPFTTALGGGMPIAIDLTLVAALTAIFVSILKVYVALVPKLQPTLSDGSSNPVNDQTVVALAIATAAGLIALATYEPAIFNIVSMATLAATGAGGAVTTVKRVAGGTQPAPNPAPKTPAPAVGIVPAAASGQAAA